MFKQAVETTSAPSLRSRTNRHRVRLITTKSALGNAARRNQVLMRFGDVISARIVFALSQQTSQLWRNTDIFADVKRRGLFCQVHLYSLVPCCRKGRLSTGGPLPCPAQRRKTANTGPGGQISSFGGGTLASVPAARTNPDTASRLCFRARNCPLRRIRTPSRRLFPNLENADSIPNST